MAARSEPTIPVSDVHVSGRPDAGAFAWCDDPVSCQAMAEVDLGVRDAKGEWQPANLPQRPRCGTGRCG